MSRPVPTIEPAPIADRPFPDPDAAPAVEAVDDLEVVDEQDEQDEQDEIDYGPITTTALRVDDSSTHGTGVFAVRDFEVDEIVERCPVLVLPRDQAYALADTVLGDYVYEWEDGCAVALGFGSLYNHSRTSNARYEMDYDLVEIDVVAVRPITAGDDFINYNGDPTVTTPVWFETE